MLHSIPFPTRSSICSISSPTRENKYCRPLSLLLDIIYLSFMQEILPSLADFTLYHLFHQTITIPWKLEVHFFCSLKKSIVHRFDGFPNCESWGGHNMAGIRHFWILIPKRKYACSGAIGQSRKSKMLHATNCRIKWRAVLNFNVTFCIHVNDATIPRDPRGQRGLNRRPPPGYRTGKHIVRSWSDAPSCSQPLRHISS